MSPDRKYSIVDPPVCLEEGQRYEIILTLDRYQDMPEQKANILIDSVSYK